MPNTITVKGLGRAAARPDLAVLSMILESKDREYVAAMETASVNIDLLNDAIVGIGFEKKLKTTSFNVYADYTDEQQKDGGFKRVFAGYVVRHDLKLEFDFDKDKLAETISAVGSCAANPQLNIAFTVKDPSEINEEMLRSATENARKKAEILCSAAGKTLGALLSIDYSWDDINIRSGTNYRMADECFGAPMMAKSIAIEPDDINVSDSASFVWEIK